MPADLFEMDSAIRARNRDRVGELLREGVSPNGEGLASSPLVVAAGIEGADGILEDLVKAGGDVNTPWKGTTYILDRAVSEGCRKNVDVLLRAGAKLNRESRSDTLIKGVEKGDSTIVANLLEAGADPQLEDREGLTPLYYAELRGISHISSLLRARGATLTPWDRLRLAIERKEPEALEAVLREGFDLKGDRGEFALAHACRRDVYSALVRLLIEHGADPNGGRKPGCPLSVAARCNAVQNVQLLLEAGADASLRDTRGLTAVQAALHNPLTNDAARLLLQMSTCPPDDLLIWYVREHDLTATLDLIRSTPLDRGFATRGVDTMGWTALEWAVYEKQPQIVEALIERGWVVTPRTKCLAEYRFHPRFQELWGIVPASSRTGSSIVFS